MANQAQLREEEAKRLESHAAWEARQVEEEEIAKVKKCFFMVELSRRCLLDNLHFQRSMMVGSYL